MAIEWNKETIMNHTFVLSKKLKMLSYIYEVEDISLGNQQDNL